MGLQVISLTWMFGAQERTLTLTWSSSTYSSPPLGHRPLPGQPLFLEDSNPCLQLKATSNTPETLNTAFSLFPFHFTLPLHRSPSSCPSLLPEFPSPAWPHSSPSLTLSSLARLPPNSLLAPLCLPPSHPLSPVQMGRGISFLPVP